MHIPDSLFLLFAQAATNANNAPAEEPSLLSPWMVFFLIVLLIGLPFLLGTLFARMLKMKEISTRLSVVLLVTELGLTPFAAQYVVGALEQRRYEQQSADWKKKQEARDTISRKDIDALKKELPGLAIEWEPPAEPETKKKPKVEKSQTGGKTSAKKSTAKKSAAEKTKTEKTEKTKTRKTGKGSD